MTTPNLQTAYQFSELDECPDWTTAYWQQGYVIIRNVFTTDEIDRIATRFDHWYEVCMQHRCTYRHQNHIAWINHHPEVGRYVRGIQWPSYTDPVLNAIRTDPRFLKILTPLIGTNLKQIINQLHWKTPNTGQTWGLHRDRRSRTPASAFRDLARSYVQMGLAVDRHWSDNGAMKILPGSHNLPSHSRDQGSGSYQDTGEKMWRESGADLSQLIDVEMEPGDVALWGPDTVHGGGINVTPDNFRRLYINGYVIAENCDRGEWTFANGNPVPLNPDEPALIQFDAVREQTEPFYYDQPDPSAMPSD